MLEPLTKAIAAIRAIESEMPLPQLHCFLIIAGSEEGLSLTDLARMARIGAASCSRYVAALGKVDRHREDGLGLVQAHEDPLERRKKIVTLTHKGRALINRINSM